MTKRCDNCGTEAPAFTQDWNFIDGGWVYRGQKSADEIERLREQVEYLKANIEQLVHEAVRGE